MLFVASVTFAAPPGTAATTAPTHRALTPADPVWWDQYALSTDPSHRLLERAQSIVHSKRNVWAKALALRGFVRSEIDPKSGLTCAHYAIIFAKLAQQLGIPARVVAGSMHMLNAYDTHTVNEVYLPSLRKWVVLDPMMDTHPRVGNRAVSAFEIWRNRARLIWEPSTHPNALVPWRNYISPTSYFRHVGVYVWDGPRPPDYVWGRRDLARVRPGAYVSPQSNAAAAPALVRGVPWYAERKLAQGYSREFTLRTAQPVVVVVRGSDNAPMLVPRDRACVDPWTLRDNCGPHVAARAGDAWLFPVIVAQQIVIEADAGAEVTIYRSATLAAPRQ